MGYFHSKTTILGNVTNEPGFKVSEKGHLICYFPVATTRKYKTSEGEPKNEVEIHSVTAYGGLAEICEKFLQNTSKIFVEGYLRTKKWVDDDGHKNYRTEIVAQNIIFLKNLKNENTTF